MKASDWTQIADIYMEGIRTKVATFQSAVPSWEDWDKGHCEACRLVARSGATIGLAPKGLLNSRQHTSNDLKFLKMICPDYAGEKYYNQESAVTDGYLITASGIAPLYFNKHVLKALDVFQ